MTDGRSDDDPTSPGTGVRAAIEAERQRVKLGRRVDGVETRVGAVEKVVAGHGIELERLGAGQTATVQALAKGTGTPLVRAHHDVVTEARRAQEHARQARQSVTDEAARIDDVTLAIGRHLAVALGSIREVIDANDVRQTRRDAALEDQVAALRQQLAAGAEAQLEVRRQREEREALEREQWRLDRIHARWVRFAQLVIVPIVTAALAAAGAYFASREQPAMVHAK